MTASEAKERINNYCSGCVGNFQGDCEKTCEFPTIIKALDLLEKQEQNRIIELPVPCGAEVYWVTNSRIDKTVMDRFVFDFWGERAFATREEAEKRLEELRNEQTDVH